MKPVWLFRRLGRQVLIFGVLFLVSLLIPASREMHVLAARFLLHVRGDTFVRGQPSGCAVYTIPNVQFTEKHQQELRERSRNSLEDYVVARATRDYFKLQLPPAAVATNHPLLQWAAFQFASIPRQYQAPAGSTNRTVPSAADLSSMKTAQQFVQLAQSVDSTNGALSLAEAVLYFGEQRDEVALAALRLAATNGDWNAHTEKSFGYIVKLFENAGLSRLDAAIEANFQAPSYSVLALQGMIRRQLERLMIMAVTNRNDRRFSELLGILVELRKAEWADKDTLFANSFRYFSFPDDLINAMTARLGQDPLPESKEFSVAIFEKQRTLRRQVFHDFLAKHADGQVATAFLAQTSTVKTEKKLRRQINEAHFQAFLWPGVGSSAAGAMALFLLSLLVIGVLCGLPFVWLKRSGNTHGQWPRSISFWMASALVLVISIALFCNFLFAIGIYSKVGFGPAEPPPALSPFVQALLLSFVLCAVLFGGLLGSWKASKTPVKLGPPILFLADAYCMAVLVAAFFRDRLVAHIMAGLF